MPMRNSDSDTAQRLAEVIASGDIERAQRLVAGYRQEVVDSVAAAGSGLERELLLAEALESTRMLLRLARSLRSQVGVQLRETKRTAEYLHAMGAGTRTSWNFKA